MVATVTMCERCRWSVKPGDDVVVAMPAVPGAAPDALDLEDGRPGEPPAVFHRRCWNPADRHWRRLESLEGSRA